MSLLRYYLHFPFSETLFFFFFSTICFIKVAFFLVCVVLDVIEVFIEKEYTGAVQWSTRRSVAEVGAGNSSLILAETRTHRKDPLDGFKRYTGGWNISNGHYWAVSFFLILYIYIYFLIWVFLFP